MKVELKAGLQHELRYRVKGDKTVPSLYPESPEFAAMPPVFATGFLVGLLEWACIAAIHPLLAAGQQTLGTHVCVSHAAPTLPGEELRVNVVLTRVEGRRLEFDVQAHDAAGLVSSGTHQRFIIDRQRFDEKLARRSA